MAGFGSMTTEIYPARDRFEKLHTQYSERCLCSPRDGRRSTAAMDDRETGSPRCGALTDGAMVSNASRINQGLHAFGYLEDTHDLGLILSRKIHRGHVRTYSRSNAPTVHF